MRTATVRDLRNHYLKLMEWVAAGEVIIITKHGKPIARLSPESATSAASIDWSKSPAVMRDRSGEAVLTAAESEELLREFVFHACRSGIPREADHFSNLTSVYPV